jgi:hypothetical protein
VIKAMVRRWLGLDGPGGLADVLAVRDQEFRALATRVESHQQLFGKVVPVLNDHTTSLERFVVYEQQVPSIKRVFNAMRERALREQRRKAAEQALAAAPVVEPEPQPPIDGVLDDVSAEVGGG